MWTEDEIADYKYSMRNDPYLTALYRIEKLPPDKPDERLRLLAVDKLKLNTIDYQHVNDIIHEKGKAAGLCYLEDLFIARNPFDAVCLAYRHSKLVPELKE